MENVGLNASISENSQAQASLVKSLKNQEVGNDKERTEAEVFLSKLDHRASVKGKKAIARARVHKETFQSIAGSCQVLSSPVQPVNRLPQENRHQIESDGKLKQRRELHPSITPWPEVGFKFRGICGGEEREGGHLGSLGSSLVRGNGPVVDMFDGGVDGLTVCSEAFGETAREKVGSVSMDPDVVFRGGADHGDVEAECMDLEGRGHAVTSC